MELAVLVVLALVGWQIAARVRLPIATMIGPMIIIGAAICLGLPQIALPSWVRVVVQVIIGVYAGSRVTRNTVQQMGKLGKSIAFATFWTVGASVAIGLLVGFLAHVDHATALLGCAPGGAPEMTAMALAVGANGPMVALLHTSRLVTTVALVPFLARRDFQARAVPALAGASAGAADGVGPLPVYAGGQEITSQGATLAKLVSRANKEGKKIATGRLLFTLAAGVAGAVLFSVVGVPAGGLVGSLLAVALASTTTSLTTRPPVALSTAGQLAVGVQIGLNLTPEAMRLLLTSIPLVVLITATTLGSGLMLSNFVQRSLGSDKSTALLACAPGGLTQMPIIADELGADITPVTMFQLARFVCSIVVLPILFRILV
ncbi:MAG: AbrB family transcriptional regulator [Chloroflexota bacterium]